MTVRLPSPTACYKLISAGNKELQKMTDQPDQVTDAGKVQSAFEELRPQTVDNSPAYSMRVALDIDPRDWSLNRTDAWVYGIVVGWGDALSEVARRHGWNEHAQHRLSQLHELCAGDYLRWNAALDAAVEVCRDVPNNSRMLMVNRGEVSEYLAEAIGKLKEE